ncbi:ankyrin repeat domain-containing protein [Legionella sp. WA2022007384]
MRMRLETIVHQGVDITGHYLAPQQQYKVFRHQGFVYAVRYDDNPPKATEYIAMWRSHNKESAHSRVPLDKGLQGVVFTKTKDKAAKHFKTSYQDDDPLKNLHDSQEMNLKLLNQKFDLHHLKIDKHFIIGLHNNKRALDKKLDREHAHIEYIMPKIEETQHINDDSLIQFIHALKIANEHGYAHPDYCLSPYHTSFQNEFYTEDGIKLFDLDMGLHEFSSSDFSTDQNAVYSRDQWLLVYNHKKQATPHWREDSQTWYMKNPGKALSEHPVELLDLVSDGTILLPPDIVKDLEKQASLLPPKPKTSSPFISAVKKGDLKSVQQLIALEGSRAESKEHRPLKEEFDQALILAAKHNHIDIVKELLSAGADVNAKENEYNAMRFAIENTNIPLVKVLLRAGANSEFLLEKIEDWDSMAFREILHEVGLNQAGDALLTLVENHNFGMVRKLVTADPKCLFINHVGESQKTPLMLAAEKGDKRTVKLLLRAGADDSLRDANGKTAEELAMPSVQFNTLLAEVLDEKKGAYRQKCMQKLTQIYACRFNDDVGMTEFIRAKKTAIANCTNLNELVQLHKNLNDIYKQLKPVSDALKTTLTDLSAKMEFGASAKAKSIEEALVNVPVEERNLDFDYESPAKKSFPVLAEMARPRGFWGKPGEVEVDKKSGVIVEDKAAKTYTEFRKTMATLRKVKDNTLSSDSDFSP